jgi:hypothetical protein
MEPLLVELIELDRGEILPSPFDLFLNFSSGVPIHGIDYPPLRAHVLSFAADAPMTAKATAMTGPGSYHGCLHTCVAKQGIKRTLYYPASILRFDLKSPQYVLFSFDHA